MYIRHLCELPDRKGSSGKGSSAQAGPGWDAENANKPNESKTGYLKARQAGPEADPPTELNLPRRPNNLTPRWLSAVPM